MFKRILNFFEKILKRKTILIKLEEGQNNQNKKDQGFKKELKPVRIYGLMLIMMSVFKMVVIDVWNQQSIIRVITLIIGGIICFGISAAYTKIEKKQIEKIEKKELTEKDFWDKD